MTDPVKLKAISLEDLPLVSSLVQDAVITARDTYYDAKAMQFIIMANRYKWERKPYLKHSVWNLLGHLKRVLGFQQKKHQEGLRQRCALHFNGVLSVQKQGLDTQKSEDILALLDIKAKPHADQDGFILDLIFSQNITIRLKTEMIELFLTDVGTAYEAIATPDHDIERAASAPKE